MIVRCCLAALMLCGRLAVAQDPTVVVREAGPGPVGRHLAEVLRRPDTRVMVADTVRLARGSRYAGAVVVVGKRAEVSGTVEGDVVVVGGDLFLKPGGQIGGEGIAIGGGTYNSLLGSAAGGLTPYRDFTFDAARTGDRIELSYREDYVGSTTSVLSLPGVFGLRIPTYDRSNGLSLAAGPTIAIARGSVDLLATYRSQIGKIDPSASGRYDLNRTAWIEGFAGRESRSNDGWINGRLSNSLNAVLIGRDERNWYRATGAWATVNRMFEGATSTSTYSVGASTERAAPARPGALPTSGPWSLTGRTSDEGMFRPNPQISAGTIHSVIGGADFGWTAGDVRARLDLALEVPVSTSSGDRFAQLVLDGRVGFPTFGLQRYRLEAHGVVTSGEAPGQRFAYLGGSGTLATEDLFSMGGDELLFLESRYEVPLTAIVLPFAGSPTLTFRHILGSAGVQTLPDVTQIVGARISIPFVRVQLLMDTDTRKVKFSAGLSLSR